MQCHSLKEMVSSLLQLLKNVMNTYAHTFEPVLEVKGKRYAHHDITELSYFR